MFRRMLLTFKQNRFETIASVLVGAVLSGLALYVAWQLNSVVFPKGCSPNLYGPVMVGPDSPGPDWSGRACEVAQESFNNIRYGTLTQLVSVGLFLAPFLIGILMGAPLVARELEQNTAPLSWALVGSRRRWLLARVASILVVFVPAVLAIGLAADVLQGAQARGVSPWASFEGYGYRGVLVVFWALAAFAGTMSLGTLLGRSLPAIFVALIICLFARVGGEYVFQRVILAPYAQQLMTWQQLASENVYPWSPSDLTISYSYYLDGKPFTGDVNQWYMTHQPPGIEGNTGPIAVAGPTPAPAPSAGASSDPANDPSTTTGPQFWGPQSIPWGFHGNQYWSVVLAECGILLAGALVCGGVGWFWVDRRRPY